MKKFWNSRKFWFLILALIGIGLFLFFFLIKNWEVPEGIQEELSEEVKRDKTPPSTAVISPEDKSWHNKSFTAEINDSDLGSGLKECRYIIEDLATNGVSGGLRKCDPVKINVPVGKDKVCSSSYQKENPSQGKCKVSTIALDKAGNESGWKSRVFNIDLIKPKVNQVALEKNNLEINKNYLFETSVSDNSKIIGCWFYLDGKNTEKKVKISPLPCQDNKECRISVNYSFDKEGDYYINFSCSDIAGNLGSNEYQKVKITTNHPPEISSCKVVPSQGTLQTEFQFEVEVSDPEGDNLSFLWNFGDGKVSKEENPKYQYTASGTYEPKVIVTDSKGEKTECSTAWIVVSGD